MRSTTNNLTLENLMASSLMAGTVAHKSQKMTSRVATQDKTTMAISSS